MKTLVKILVCVIVVFSFISCRAKKANAPTEQPQQQQTTTDNTTYEDIYNEYANKIQTITDDLINEWNQTDGSEKLEKLASTMGPKLKELASLSHEGIEKMEAIHEKNKEDGTYQEWENKLTDVVKQCEQRIKDAYTQKMES